MGWIYKATGHMTLSILDEYEFQILRVDMKACNTMQAGRDGEILLRTYNDLCILAGFSDGKYQISINDDLPYPQSGVSPTPWALEYNEAKKVLRIKSGNRTIADRTFPKSFCVQEVNEVISIINKGIEMMSTTN